MSELERLRDRVAELEDATGLTAKVPRHLIPRDLISGARVASPMVCRVIGILLTRDFGDRDALFSTLYGAKHEDEQPDIKCLDIHVSQARRGLRSLGVEIKTLYGRGWYMDEANKTKLRALIKTMEAA